MVLHLLIVENEERRCLMVERLLEEPEDIYEEYFGNYRLPHNILQLAHELQPAL